MAASRADLGDGMVLSRRFPVVCVGASAGGLEAFTALLHSLPSDTNMAFVLVQHLDPKHESMLTTLLAKATRMPIQQVEDGMVVQPDHVYVIPPNTNMEIREGQLRLMPRSEVRGQHMPIDFFMRSLAEDMQSRAVGGDPVGHGVGRRSRYQRY